MYFIDDSIDDQYVLGFSSCFDKRIRSTSCMVPGFRPCFDKYWTTESHLTKNKTRNDMIHLSTLLQTCNEDCTTCCVFDTCPNFAPTRVIRLSQAYEVEVDHEQQLQLDGLWSISFLVPPHPSACAVAAHRMDKVFSFWAFLRVDVPVITLLSLPGPVPQSTQVLFPYPTLRKLFVPFIDLRWSLLVCIQ